MADEMKSFVIYYTGEFTPAAARDVAPAGILLTPLLGDLASVRGEDMAPRQLSWLRP
jgi:hypothetical protein